MRLAVCDLAFMLDGSPICSRIRDERGQTAAEYLGVIVVVALIIATIVGSGLDGKISSALSSVVTNITSGKSDAKGKGSPGGPGAGGSVTAPNGTVTGPGGTVTGPDGTVTGPGGTVTGPGGTVTGPGGTVTGPDGTVTGPNGTTTGPGANGSGGAGTGAGGGATGPDGGGGGPCLSSTAAAGYCLKLLDSSRYFKTTAPNAALDRVKAAQKRILTSGLRTGDPALQKLVDARSRAIDDYKKTIPLRDSKAIAGLNGLRRVINPNAKDIKAGLDGIKSKLPGKKGGSGASGEKSPTVPKPNTASGGPPPAESAAKRVLGKTGKFLSKTGKGLGALGTALGAVSNVKKDGLAKGATETAGGILGGAGGGSLAAAGCAALAPTGVGLLACGAGVLVVSAVGSEAGKRVAAATYDHVVKPVGKAIYNKGVKPVYDHVLKPVGHVAAKGAKVFAGGVKTVTHGASKVIGALNPF